MNTILVVDDEINILEIIELYLKKEGYNVMTATNGNDAIELIQKEQISLIVLDLMLPDMSGEEICKRVRETSSVPIIMVTAKTSEEDIIAGLNMGADDYITKPFSPRQLVARVSSTLRRAMPIGLSTKLQKGELVIDLDNRTLHKNLEEIILTKSEYDILLQIMKRPQKIFTRDEIITLAFEDESNIYDRTIDTHIKNLRKKIEDNPRTPKYVITVYGVGYRFGGE